MTTTPPTPAIVFDLGGVLIDWNPRHLYRKVFSDEQEMERFLAEVCTQSWNARQDAGYPFEKAIQEKIAEYPAYTDLIQLYHDRWDEMVLGAIEPTVEILRSVKQAGYRVYGLSNWSMEKFNRIRPNFEFLEWLDLLLVSGDIGLIKPDPRFFQVFLDRTGLTAEECLFIDDHLPNIEAAERLGFQTIWFRSPEQLEAELIQRGILVKV